MTIIPDNISTFDSGVKDYDGSFRTMSSDPDQDSDPPVSDHEQSSHDSDPLLPNTVNRIQILIVLTMMITIHFSILVVCMNDIN